MPEPARDTLTVRQRHRREVFLVLALSLGRSAVYAAVSLAASLTAAGSLRQQTATLNQSASPRSLVDLSYQLLGIGFSLVPVLLALHFLSSSPGGVPGHLRDGCRRIGLLVSGRPQLLHDLRWGAGLAALVGIPGLALYFAARAVGVNATVVPSALNSHWWTLPVLVLSAFENAALEEVVVVGFLVTRCRQLGMTTRGAVAVSALVRGGYHLYQGFGGFLGNAVMGILFATYFQRRRTVLPLVIAHGLIDTVAFVGYTLLKDPLGLP